MPRAEWVLRWPGQVVIAGSQTAWTAGVEAAIEDYRMDQFFEENLLMVSAGGSRCLTLVAGLEELWTMPRAEWVLRWPGQVVIAGSQTAWTAGVEAAIEDYRMDQFFEENLLMLDSLRGLVKGELTFFQREVVCALIVIEVHARDVTRTLVDENVKNVSDFQWTCQLRYYQVVKPMYEFEEGESREIYQDENRLDTAPYYRQFSQNYCDVKALNSVFKYSSEYLGNR
ncbi:dynein heavy chain 1, axonemal-like [Ostrinia furnacalis]|uniref:dynein heavy chain 1, axonemal-like n=1 Tax=Ostrinia furnacalis TaxID=93504 RepID=UPI00103EDC59|nr:dynein heavy chain 1, axonemal-like [Ostrinia furnacalis]